MDLRSKVYLLAREQRQVDADRREAARAKVAGRALEIVRGYLDWGYSDDAAERLEIVTSSPNRAVVACCDSGFSIRITFGGRGDSGQTIDPMAEVAVECPVPGCEESVWLAFTSPTHLGMILDRHGDEDRALSCPACQLREAEREITQLERALERALGTQRVVCDERGRGYA